MNKETINFAIMAHIMEYAADGCLDGIDPADYHHEIFNRYPYITYNSRALKFMKEHEIDVWEALIEIRELSNAYGLDQPEINGPECLVNNLIYLMSLELMDEQLLEEIEAYANDHIK